MWRLWGHRTVSSSVFSGSSYQRACWSPGFGARGLPGAPLEQELALGSLPAFASPSPSRLPSLPPLLTQPRTCGSASPAPQLCSSPRLGALGPLPDSGKGDLPCEASFSDPESEAKRRIVFTISAGASSAKQSPSSKHSPLPSGARGDGGQGHGPDSRKRGRRKRASAGTPSLSSSVSPKRRALPSVAGLFTQSSGSPLNLNSMVRREQRAGAGWLMRAHARPAGTHACARPLGQQHQPAPGDHSNLIP